MSKHVLIVGAGLAGSLLAVYLARAGWTVEVRERRSDPRAAGHVSGRSINLAISARGLKALRRVGLEDAILRDAIRMPGRMIHPPTGALNFQQYSANPAHAIQSVSRSALNLTLILAAAAEKGVTIRFDQRCSEIDAATGTATFIDNRTGESSRAQVDLIVGTDGAYSVLRSAMERNEGFDYQQSWLSHGYKELSIPAVSTGPHAPFAMAPHALHIWPRGGSMMIALPNPDGSFTCTLFWPHTTTASARGFDSIATAPIARQHFEAHYADALPLMPTFDDDFNRNAVGWMVTVRARPWSRGGRVVLLGDAAHAIVPFFGQGANASFEDCEALTDALTACGDDIALALANYELARKRNTDAIAEMALENFIEMRDKTASPLFRWRKRVEHFIHGVAPALFTPRYDMVSFETIPYADALAKSRKQDRVLSIVAVAAAVGVVVALIAIITRFIWWASSC